MKGIFIRIISGIAIIAIASYIIHFLIDDNSSIQPQLLVTPPEVIGFTRADGSRSLVFPADHGAHPNFQTEWWYYTGNLQAQDGRHFGYQLTFFRRSLLPPDEVQDRSSTWSTNQVFMAHFSLTDVAAESFHYYERFSRAAAGLAGAQAPPFRVWLDNWSVEQIDKHQYLLQAAQNDIAIELILTDEKGPVLHGENGYSRKGHEPGNASYYFSQTRLVSEGYVVIKDQRFAVVGNSWMDHEFSTSALSSDQVGWDWFALQLDDGSELMLFQIRKDGNVTEELIDLNSSGTIIHADGSYSHLNLHDFEIIVHDTWKSPHSGAVYPAGWKVNIPQADISLMVKPYIPDQELLLSFTYWEGAVGIVGSVQGQQVSGSGYAELTGYAGSMAGEF